MLEVGSQGIQGGQVRVPDVEGSWYELFRNVRTRFFPLRLRRSSSSSLHRLPLVKRARFCLIVYSHEETGN
jgi:hypothetical protein